MDDGLPGVGHVCDDAIGQDQQDEVLLQSVGCQVTMGTEKWGRQGQEQLCTQVTSVHSDYSNSDTLFLKCLCRQP